MGWGAGPNRASVQESLPGGSWSLQRGSLSVCSVALVSHPIFCVEGTVVCKA